MRPVSRIIVLLGASSAGCPFNQQPALCTSDGTKPSFPILASEHSLIRHPSTYDINFVTDAAPMTTWSGGGDSESEHQVLP